MSALGSVFLGDFQRHRVLSSTPPSSPPPVSSFDGNTTIMAVASSEHPDDVLESLDGTESPATGKTSSASLPEGRDPTEPTHIDPVLSLELRLRWLEALLLGVRQDTRDRKARPGEKPSELKPGESLIQLAVNLQRRLNSVVESNDGLKKFMHQYDQHAQLLTPAFALSGTMQGPAPTYDNMAAEELEALLSDMEPDVRAADRDMREIELLEQKGVLSAGKLADYEALQPRLHALLAAQEQDMTLAASLEKRVATLVKRHATHVDTLSELFVAWDDVVTETESKVRRLERDKEERQRLGYA